MGNDNAKMIFSAIEEKMKEQGIGVRELLRRTGVSSTVFYKLRNGEANVRMSVIERLFEGLGGTISYTIEIKEKEEN